MELLQIINDLEKEGKLRQLMDAGLLSTNVLTYREICLYLQKEKAINPDIRVNTITTWAMDTFRCSKSTVFLAMRTFGVSFKKSKVKTSCFVGTL